MTLQEFHDLGEKITQEAWADMGEKHLETSASCLIKTNDKHRTWYSLSLFVFRMRGQSGIIYANGYTPDECLNEYRIRNETEVSLLKNKKRETFDKPFDSI